jgi:hypothetical protein
MSKIKRKFDGIACAIRIPAHVSTPVGNGRSHLPYSRSKVGLLRLAGVGRDKIQERETDEANLPTKERGIAMSTASAFTPQDFGDSVLPSQYDDLVRRRSLGREGEYRLLRAVLENPIRTYIEARPYAQLTRWDSQ